MEIHGDESEKMKKSLILVEKMTVEKQDVSAMPLKIRR